MLVPFVSFIAIKFITVLIAKTAMTKLLKIPWMTSRNLKIFPTKDWDVQRNHS